MTKKQPSVKADPTLPFETIKIHDREYRMCFDLNAIADAEDKLKASGHKFNFLVAKYDEMTLAVTRALFVASLSVYHPEVDFEEGRRLFAAGETVDIANAINVAYRNFLPALRKEDKANPL